jgi:hypothetical protein
MTIVAPSTPDPARSCLAMRQSAGERCAAPALNRSALRADEGVMTRRESVRVLVFARARLIGADRSLRCAVVDLSASGAMLTVTARVPAPPLRLELELGGEKLVLPIETQRASPDGGVAVAFAQPHSEQLHHLIAVEQRRALAQHRVNISERRLPPAFRQPPEDSGS